MQSCQFQEKSYQLLVVRARQERRHAPCIENSFSERGCKVKGWQLETGCPLSIKSWSESYFSWKAKVKVKVRICKIIGALRFARKRFWRTTHHLEAIASGRWYSFRNIPSGSLLLKSDFPRSKFNFLQRLSDFREIRVNLLQRLSDFFNGFPISEKPSSILSKYSYLEYFDFPLRALKFLRKNIQTLSILSSTNRHSPHSLASVQDMFVEMGFQLNLYQQRQHDDGRAAWSSLVA